MVQPKHHRPQHHVCPPRLKPALAVCFHEVENILHHGKAHANHSAVNDAVQLSISLRQKRKIATRARPFTDSSTGGPMSEHRVAAMPNSSPKMSSSGALSRVLKKKAIRMPGTAPHKGGDQQPPRLLLVPIDPVNEAHVQHCGHDGGKDRKKEDGRFSHRL